jgi:hypothetical protein
MASDVDEAERSARAAHLKERIYLTFAALAVVITLSTHGHVTAGEAATTLIVTVMGTLLAVFTADLISHIVAHGRLFTPPELRHAVGASFGALSTVALPFMFLGFAALGSWHVESALRASAIALLVSLVVIGWVAVRRIPLTWYQRIVALGAEAVLGLAVIGLQVLAHG